MSCTNCDNNQTPYSVYNVQYIYKADCDSCGNSGCETTILAGCVFYTSANLPNSGILTNDSLEVALQKIDAQLAAVTGDYSGYNINCLGPAGSITTEADFVNAITSYVCTLNTTVTNFIDTTFPAYQTSVDARFDALEVPGITNAELGITPTDTLNQILTKLALGISESIDEAALAGVTWSQCFTVNTPPTTIAEGFSTLLDQICQIKSSSTGAVLPTFNNVGSVLANPGPTDSLEDTVIKLRDRINLLPTFNINTLAWNSMTKPSTTNIDLQAAMTSILAKLDLISQNMPTFDANDFVEGAVDPSNIYAGKTIALSTSLDIDRFVAIDAADTSPGTLVDKLMEGTGITFDLVTNPGKLTISADAVSSDYRVKASSTDANPDFLDGKVKGGTSGAITISVSYDAADEKIQINPSLDIPNLVDTILTLAETDATVKARLCTLMASCPSPCQPPQNVQIVIVPTP